jgi:hypothetical protein
MDRKSVPLKNYQHCLSNTDLIISSVAARSLVDEKLTIEKTKSKNTRESLKDLTAISWIASCNRHVEQAKQETRLNNPMKSRFGKLKKS